MINEILGNKDIRTLSSSELNQISLTKDGLRKFLAGRSYRVNAEFIQRGDVAEAEDLQKVLDIIKAIGPDRLQGESPLLFRPGYPSSPGTNPIIGLRDSKQQCIDVVKKYYLGESDSLEQSIESQENYNEEIRVKGVLMVVESVQDNQDGTFSIRAKRKD